MKKLRLGVVQLNTRDTIETSFADIERFVKGCATDGASLVLLPELSTYLSEKEVLSVAQTMDGEIIRRFRDMAKKFGIYLNNGSFVEKSDNGKAYNTSVLINPQGEIEAYYRKIHLFDIDLPGGLSYRESDRYNRGSSVVVSSTEIGDFGFSICYDLRFPELYRSLTEKGAKLIFIPAAFTLHTGKDHWEPLLRARAIENQVYIAAADQIGKHPDNKSCYGNSMIIDPWGKVIARSPDKVGYITAEVDWDYLEEIRRKIPCLNKNYS